jgi:hypothetical protein
MRLKFRSTMAALAGVELLAYRAEVSCTEIALRRRVPVLL